MAEVFAVSSGEYSDYGVHAVFEREEDAAEYVRLANLRSGREYHERYRNRTIESGPMSSWTQAEKDKHAGEFEECAECQRRLNDHYYSLFVETFSFHPAGEVPHGDAHNTGDRPE